MIAFALANWKWLVPALLFAGLAVDDGYHRIALANCHEAAAAAKAAAEQAKAVALEDARVRSDAIITEQAERLAQTARTANDLRERARNAPVTATCGPVVRDTLERLRHPADPGGG